MKKMNRELILLKKIILFLSPFIIMTVVYIIIDPYMVIYNYADYNKNYFINKNRDFVSTEMFIKNSKERNYDSFIFGSSTSLFTPPSIWSKYIETENNIYSFDASRERLTGIWSKVKYLDEHDVKIKNALVNLESKTFMEFVNNVPLYSKHYKVYPSSSMYFQYASFLNFCDLRFVFALVHFKLSNQFFPYMNDFLVSEPYYYDTVTNEYNNIGILDGFKKDSVSYYEVRKGNFPKRSGKPLEENSKIETYHIQMLNEIRDIFSMHNTDYKILICPTYNQIEFNHSDLSVIKAIFGDENVFDFTGINRFTEDKSMYYDEFHFKKYLGKELLDSAYSYNLEKAF